jgi:hypothetical protein
MKARLPRNLSPKARKHLLLGKEGERVRALVQFAPAADPAQLTEKLENLGAVVESIDEETRLARIETEARRLGELAELEEVIYVEAGEAYRP